jgi:hypothetical protein
MATKTPVSAFEKGQAAAILGEPVANPFALGSPEHNNFEVGRRFGEQRLRGPGSLAAAALR